MLNKWPEVKRKIENAFKLSSSLTGASTVDAGDSPSIGSRSFNNSGGGGSDTYSNSQSTTMKAPKIQLKTFGNFK